MYKLIYKDNNKRVLFDTLDIGQFFNDKEGHLYMKIEVVRKNNSYYNTLYFNPDGRPEINNFRSEGVVYPVDVDIIVTR